jgi:hypothetical protein
MDIWDDPRWVCKVSSEKPVQPLAVVHIIDLTTHQCSGLRYQYWQPLDYKRPATLPYQNTGKMRRICSLTALELEGLRRLLSGLSKSHQRIWVKGRCTKQSARGQKPAQRLSRVDTTSLVYENQECCYKADPIQQWRLSVMSKLF